MIGKHGLGILLILFAICFVSYGFISDSMVWKKNSRGIYESDIKNIMLDPRDDNVIYAATSKALYKSDDQGKNYRLILRPSGEKKGVNNVYISVAQPSAIYAATDAGLYESLNNGTSWNRIYYSSDKKSRKCHSVMHHQNKIYLGTQKGLFHKNVSEPNWRQMKEGFDDYPIYDIAQDDYFLYFASGHMLFRINKGTKKKRKIFTLGFDEGTDTDGLSDEVLTSEQNRLIKCLQVSSDPSYIYIASSKGIYVSSNRGRQWHRLPTSNLSLDYLTSLIILGNNQTDQNKHSEEITKRLDLMAGTKKGVFLSSGEKWMPVYKGMETNVINYLTKDTRGTIFAATAKGIFYLSLEEALPSGNKNKRSNIIKKPAPFNNDRHIDSDDLFSHEPNINKVHRLAIDYAEVNQNKIKSWRKQAQRRAWFPQLDIGVDSDRDWSSSDSIWGSYSGGGQHYIGPDDKTRGEDFGWDVSLSWDLADLIWSTDQTTIDSRSKLMVELREDILNEVTRLYFERRRIQIDLATQQAMDERITFENEMRVAELTALIDALTGGNFSKLIEKQQNRFH